MVFSRPTLFSEEEVGGYEEGEDYRDYAVHGEERGVEFGEVVGLDERVFVEKEQGYGNYAGYREFAESEGWKQGEEEEQHDEVEGAGEPESARDAEVAGDGVESGVAIELKILAGVKDVEASDPKCYNCGEEKNAGIERAADGDPGRGGRYA